MPGQGQSHSTCLTGQLLGRTSGLVAYPLGKVNRHLLPQHLLAISFINFSQRKEYSLLPGCSRGDGRGLQRRRLLGLNKDVRATVPGSR